MKKIEAIFKPFKLDEIKEALAKERIQRGFINKPAAFIPKHDRRRERMIHRSRE